MSQYDLFVVVAEVYSQVALAKKRTRKIQYLMKLNLKLKLK
jgi:hypothetical protein